MQGYITPIQTLTGKLTRATGGGGDNGIYQHATYTDNQRAKEIIIYKEDVTIA